MVWSTGPKSSVRSTHPADPPDQSARSRVAVATVVQEPLVEQFSRVPLTTPRRPVWKSSIALQKVRRAVPASTRPWGWSSDQICASSTLDPSSSFPMKRPGSSSRSVS
jgi:hypothetical protein